MTVLAHFIRAAPIDSTSLSGCQHLWYALILDALETVREGRPARQVRLDRAWLAGARAPLRFRDLCGALGLDAQAVAATVTLPPSLRCNPQPTGWRPRPPMRNATARACLECGASFLPKMSHHTYCCETHRHRAVARRRQEAV